MKKIIQVSIAAALIAASGSAAAWCDGPCLGENRGWLSTPDGDWSYGTSSGIHNPYRRNNRYNSYTRNYPYYDYTYYDYSYGPNRAAPPPPVPDK